MTKDEKISNFERVLSWLPEAFKSWATSNPFLSSTLNEVLNERDTRLSGTPCTSRLKTAVTALLQKPGPPRQERRPDSRRLARSRGDRLHAGLPHVRGHRPQDRRHDGRA